MIRISMTLPSFVRVGSEQAETLLASVRAYYAFDGIRFEVNGMRAAILSLLESPALAEAWLVQDRAEYVGHFVLSFGFDLELGGRQATLTELYLAEHARGRGLGSAALHFVQEPSARPVSARSSSRPRTRARKRVASTNAPASWLRRASPYEAMVRACDLRARVLTLSAG
jgi:GNAT superfamily N-acetyltransferase